MKKNLLIISFLLVSFATFISARSQQEGNTIPLTVRLDDSSVLKQNYPRSPMRMPVVFQNGHTLTFRAFGIESTLTLTDEAGTLFFSSLLSSDDTSVTLPQILSGRYIIHFYIGDIEYTSEITL